IAVTTMVPVQNVIRRKIFQPIGLALRIAAQPKEAASQNDGDSRGQTDPLGLPPPCRRFPADFAAGQDRFSKARWHGYPFDFACNDPVKGLLAAKPLPYGRVFLCLG